ncbi:serine/threonine-protein kinase [Dorcoceras hygrometricum]|uniref:Serine/threonine-protein kinase n=1 Tax=Dorcoceras hygrometricum TaxID=472368 RepID=A0A2Z7CKI2_9LAMI|nr:serine/threonine-protein kinase [Dorcoceras hygrometricum]
MGIDQLKFQSVQLGYLKFLQLGPSAITAQWSSDSTNQSVTTSMIALYLSGTTHLSAGHNVALSQVLNRSMAQYELERAEELSGLASRKCSSNTATSRSLFNINSGHLTGINRKSNSKGAQRHQSCPQTTTEIGGNLPEKMDSDLVIYRTTLVRTFQSTRYVLGKWVYLVTHTMSLFDLRDVCIDIGSLATLDLPMIVDLIGMCVERTVLYANHDRLVLASPISDT